MLENLGEASDAEFVLRVRLLLLRSLLDPSTLTTAELRFLAKL